LPEVSSWQLAPQRRTARAGAPPHGQRRPRRRALAGGAARARARRDREELRRRTTSSRRRDSVSEALLAQVADLESRMRALGLSPGQILDEVERQSTWLYKKAAPCRDRRGQHAPRRLRRRGAWHV